MKKKNDGFTMLEMLIVLTIISLIFTLTLPNIQKRLETIRNKGCESLIEVINANVIQYELDHEEVPGSIDLLLDEGYINEKQLKCMDGKTIYLEDGQAKVD